MLRSMYARGRTEPALVQALSASANMQAEVEPWSEAEMNAFLADVRSQGDPERGEEIFRRDDLNCLGCHALSGAGGGVGPDLSAIGVSSPLDYLINSILLPDEAIKEEFETLVVITIDGQIYQGIVDDRDANRLVLREATGERRVIPIDEIEDSKQGGSLMPQGLVHFMTRDELVDLVRFLSELGKPGPYAIATTPTIQRWRVLNEVPDADDQDRPVLGETDLTGDLVLQELDLIPDTPGAVRTEIGKIFAQLRRIDTRRLSEFVRGDGGHAALGQGRQGTQIQRQPRHRCLGHAARCRRRLLHRASWSGHFSPRSAGYRNDITRGGVGTGSGGS
jgi:putative heme-binding domain-containing protein